MNIVLIQTKQNRLYNFKDINEKIDSPQARILQKEMLDKNITLIEQAIRKNECDLIVTTEAINFPGQPYKITGNYHELIPEVDSELFLKLSELAKRGKTFIVAGAFYKERTGSKYRLFNGTFIFGRDGKLVDIYKKIHLAGDEKQFLTPGDRFVVFDTDYGKVGVCICWDMQFPEVSRELCLKGAELIVCPTWGWEQIYGHARAYENGVYVAAAMAVPYWMDICGFRNPSEVIGPDGDVLARGTYNGEEYLTCQLDLTGCHRYKNLRYSDRRPCLYANISK